MGEEMAVVGAGDFALVSFVDDNVEQLPVAVLGVGVVTFDVDTAAAGEPSWAYLASVVCQVAKAEIAGCGMVTLLFV